MKKVTKFIGVPLVLSISFSFVSPHQTEALNGNEPSYFYYTPAGKPVYKSTSYGSWVAQPGAMRGPIKMEVSTETKTNWSVTGTGGISRGTIDGALELVFGKEKTLKTTASRSIPKGKKGTFKKRSVYKHYTQKYDQWFTTDGHRSKTGKTKTIKIKRKSDIESKISVTK